MTVAIERAHAATDEVRGLLAELDAFLAASYAAEQRHGVAVDALFAPNVRFYLAREDGVAIGCGGVAFFDGFAEVKRMYVRPTARGRGIARMLLAHIEDEVRSAGGALLRLETGIHQPAAIRLYERAGFVRRDAFGPYAAMDPAAIVASLFFEKQIVPNAEK